jgi:hypothetical protein
MLRLFYQKRRLKQIRNNTSPDGISVVDSIALGGRQAIYCNSRRKSSKSYSIIFTWRTDCAVSPKITNDFFNQLIAPQKEWILVLAQPCDNQILRL